MNKSLKELSSEELQKELKSSKNLLIFHILTTIITLSSTLTITINKGIGVYIFLPFAFAFFAFRSWRSYKKIRSEIKARNFK